MKELTSDELRLLSYILLRASDTENPFNMHNDAIQEAREIMIKINKD